MGPSAFSGSAYPSICDHRRLQRAAFAIRRHHGGSLGQFAKFRTAIHKSNANRNDDRRRHSGNDRSATLRRRFAWRPIVPIPFPVTRIALERTVQLVSTARLKDPVLLKLVRKQYLDDVAEIEGATSGRLTAQRQGTDGLQAHELVSGLPHSYFINAAFAYFRPRELNRFNGPARGAWYAALNAKTCKIEVAFHLTRELQRVNDFSAVVDYAEMFASFAGEFADLRNFSPRPDCLDPDPALGYPAGNSLAEMVRAKGHNGIVYPSVRHDGGTCLVALWPVAVQSVAQGRVLRAVWKGSPTPQWSELQAS